MTSGAASIERGEVPPDPVAMRWTIIITTHNRSAELKVTLTRLRGLEPAAEEILVCADGCTDDTAAVVREFGASVRLLENADRLGSVPSRDRLIRAARGDLILSVDDDSYPVESNFLAVAAQRFARNPSLAILTFPQRSDEFPASLEQKDFGRDAHVASYASSGVVLRRSVYLSLPGYVTLFGHIFEEPDYALQCLAAKWQVQRHTGLTIRHHYSPRNRNEVCIHHLQARNEFWSVLLRCPSPQWPFVLLRRAAGQFAYAWRRGPAWVIREPRWWWAAFRGCRRAWRQRQPIAWTDYARWRDLLRAPEELR